MRSATQSDSDRGQAYTLEGFVSAMVVLMAVLFALQSVVITPTTGGMADRTIKSQMEQETRDALVVGATANGSEGNGNLSTLVRYWNYSEDSEPGEFYNASDGTPESHYDASNDTELYEEFVLGRILTERFTERGLSYNVELVYQNGTDTDEYGSTHLVYQGESEAMTASYTVALYESDNLTAPDDEDVRIREAHEEGAYPIPPATGENESEIYNVVEVRVAVW